MTQARTRNQPARNTWILLFGCSLLLFFFWLPGLKYPIVSDTITYLLLGKNVWTTGSYAIDGVLHAKHLPLYALLSYPLTLSFGAQIGMKLASLFPAIGVLLLTYILFKRETNRSVAILAAIVLGTHHGFVLMTMLGSADMLHAFLFLAAIFAYSRAARDRRWYYAAGACAGLALLTRYNALPLFFIFPLHAFFRRRKDTRSKELWLGLLLGLLIFLPWPIRNLLTFGSLTPYAQELAEHSEGTLALLTRNFLFYINPVHTVLLLFPFALFGIIQFWRKHLLLFLALIAGALVGLPWWVLGFRFIVPAIPFLICFGLLGIGDVYRRLPRMVAPLFLGLMIIAVPVTHVAALCLYTYGECNAFFDAHVGVLPKNLGLTSEGFYAWSRARDAANALLLPESTIAVEGAYPELGHLKGMFRGDLSIVDVREHPCPSYRITQNPEAGDMVIFTTEEFPKTSIVVRKCM
jgi:4-amino-4-deoxy-L-arabinose transferase-like glycosyltransferase